MCENLSKNLEIIFQDKYIVPLYQRNFAWQYEHITTLLQDAYESFTTNPTGKYFIGSLIVLKRQNGDYEVIDGQQRLTVLSLITKILNKNKTQKLYYDARKDVEIFFADFYNKYEKIGDSLEIKTSSPTVQNLRNAISFIENGKLDSKDPKSKITIKTLYETDNETFEKFADYFYNNVILVRVELPEETDVASYFEIMNNRGEQLKKHEIIKALMMKNIVNNDDKKRFARIWDACSLMNVPVQKFFMEERSELFGEYYDELKLDKINLIKEKSIKDNDDDETEFKSIIDFPNFLMHIFKLYYSNYTNNEINLNEKYISSVYKEIEEKIDSMDFAKKLLKTKVLFDRFIVKTIASENSEDHETWSLKKPYKYSYKHEGKTVNTLKFERNTFENNQERILKALSMLQVTFRTRIYKNWLQDVLVWISKKAEDNINNISEIEYKKFLDCWICNFFDNDDEYKEILESDKMYSKGTSTPHFLFNFIDYLYLVEKENGNPHNLNIQDVEKFDFKYWNSIEHHLSQEKSIAKGISTEIMNSLGNLCLISKSTNSVLSNRDVKEKVQSYGKGNLGSNRQIIYRTTENNNFEWNEFEIKNHYAELKKLLGLRYEILGITKEDIKNLF